MSYSAAKSIAYAQSQIGVTEVPNGSNCQGYSEWQYGVRCPPGGWCMSFASRVTVEGGFIFDGATHGERGFSFTESAEQWARARGLWRDKNWKASPGDWVIFDWDGGLTDHGEVVEADDGTMLVTIGGNTSNAVKHRLRDRLRVTGFVAFSASEQAAPAIDPKEVARLVAMDKWRHRVHAKALRFGDKNHDVEILNNLLRRNHFLYWWQRGDTFGKATRTGNVKFKNTVPHLASQSAPAKGETFGGDAADALVALGR